MKNFTTSLFILFFGLLFTGCGDLSDSNISPECIGDVAVTALTVVGDVVLGEIVDFRCVIENVSNAASSCTGTATVSRAYSAEYSENFNDYEVFDKKVHDLDSFDAGEDQVDTMPMPTEQGPGFYAMSVELDTPNDSNSSNDNRGWVVHVD